MKCAIIGLGRIGSALYKDLWPRLSYLTGLDIDEERVRHMRSLGYNASLDYRDLSGIDTYIVCSSSGPNMENIFSIVGGIEPKPGSLISVESTLKVGTMARVAQMLEDRGYRVGTDVYLIHVPHRVMFFEDSSTISMPRVIGGVTKSCLDKGKQFYGGFIERLFPVTDIRIAELAKVVENTQRHVDIAYAEALALYCKQLGIDFPTLREAVNTKGNVSLSQVDYGIGGECLPKDIVFLNDLFPSPIFTGAIEADAVYRAALTEAAMAAKGAVLVRGIGYKRNSPDTYKSRGAELAKDLMSKGVDVYVEDSLLTPQQIEAEGFSPAFSGLTYSLIIDRGQLTYPV